MMNDPVIRNYVRDQAPALSPYADLGRGSFGYQMGTRLPELAKPGALKPVGNWLAHAGVNSPSFALGGALAGGVAGAGYGLARRHKPLVAAATGALAGAGGAYLLSELLKYVNADPSGIKRSFYAQDARADPYQFIEQALARDNSSGNATKQQLLPMISRLAPPQQQELAGLLRGAGAGGIIYLIARYLLKLGVGGSLILSILGGSAFSSTAPQNAYGQKTDTRHDAFGNTRFIF